MKIIDFHMHPYLREQENLRWFPGGEAPDEIRSALEASGITHCCGSIVSNDKSLTMWDLNDMALQLQEKMVGFYTPGFHIHPAEQERSLQEIERMHQRGIRLMGELVPYWYGWNDFRNTNYAAELEPMLCAAEKYDMVFSFHTDWSWQMEELIEKHPDLPFVAAHPGERESVGRHIERMRKYDNCYLDISGTGVMRLGALEHLVNSVGADRILFGTDYPISNHDLYVHCVKVARISDSDKEKIFHLNAERLLGL